MVGITKCLLGAFTATFHNRGIRDMRTPRFARKFLVLAMAAMLLPMIGAGAASAQATTISAELGRCRPNVDNYQVQLQTGDFNAPGSAFPSSVTIHFEDGSTGEATITFLRPGGTQTYTLNENRGIAVTGATTMFDTELYPNYRFTVVARPEPCYPAPAPVVHTVSGTIVQRGNERPVTDLTVCLLEAELCTTTDANGSFDISGVEDGTYTLYTNGDNWKPQYNTVTVSGGDVHIDVIQFKGGGRGN